MSSPLPLAGVPGRMTRRLAAITLGGEVPVLVFGAVAAMGLTRLEDPATASTYLWVGCGLAFAALLAAATMRWPFGVTLGWLVQAGALFSGFVVPVMFVVGGIFLGLWIVSLVQGHRMDELTRRYLAHNPPAGPGDAPSRLLRLKGWV